jgi:hypothetical protein
MILNIQGVVAMVSWTSETSPRKVEINHFNVYFILSRSQIYNFNFQTKKPLYISSHYTKINHWHQNLWSYW